MTIYRGRVWWLAAAVLCAAGVADAQTSCKGCGSLLLLVMEETRGQPLQTSLSQTRSAQSVAAKACKSTVILFTSRGRGSGFFIRPNIIATAYHVIEGVRSAYATLPGHKRKYNIKGVLAVNKEQDLALLETTSRADSRGLSIADSNLVKVGNAMYAIGNPPGLEGIFTTGTVKGRQDIKQAGWGYQINVAGALIVTAPLLPGSSGGPILDRQSRVIGVSFLSGPLKDSNFAVPSNYLKTLYAKRKARATPLREMWQRR